MSLSNKGPSSIDKTLSISGKSIRLNPDAAEFVPFALRSPSATVAGPKASSSFGNFSTTSTAPGKAALDRSESSVSNNSDDEVHQYWRHQLPDDITPDFNIAGDKDSPGVNALPFSTLSLADVTETSQVTNSFQKESSPLPTISSSFSRKMGYPVSSYTENPLSSTFQHAPAKPWNVNDDQLLNGTGNRAAYNGDLGHTYIDGMVDEQQMGSTKVNPIEFLASKFVGFGADSLADVYFANAGDLNLTIEMLTQLELQVDGGFNQTQNLNSKALSAPNLSALTFPADGQRGDDHQHHIDPYTPLEKDNHNLHIFKSSITSPSTDFASAVRKMASRDSGIWKYNQNPYQDTTIGPSRSSHVLAGSYNDVHGRMSYGERLVNRNSNRSVPVWLETGDTVANLYTEMPGEARDHERLRNAYYEQAQQAYFVGHKALAKELSVKGQLHNMQMKAAHHRNPVSPIMHASRRGQERLIDLRGLHVTEAIHVLKRDLAMLRNIARSADQHLQVYIRVGTGHHTGGARMPLAVQRCLLEEEGLDYSEPQPGLVRVQLY